MRVSAGDRLGRFEIIGRLGSGGFGDVYEAQDHECDQKVALKILRALDPEHIYRFKQEFRSLADIRHPNLVSLYELAYEADHWFFSMELVDGVDFISYVRGGSGELEDDPGSRAEAGSLMELETLDLPESLGAIAGNTLADEQRLRAALSQLAQGVRALHSRNKIHGDLKPANVLVTSEGRTVLLDFGLVREIHVDGLGNETLGAALAGTPIYMSPEQLGGGTADEASDWYSVGVMLYEGLAGRPPLAGRNILELAEAKVSRVPTPPSELVSGVPEDLNALCTDLIKISPQERPSGREILNRLRRFAGSAISPRAHEDHELHRDSVFIGRYSHLEALQLAFRDSREGKAVAIFVHGQSGMGKTKLVQRFLEDLRNREPVVVLQGACYQQETVPYKAFDGLVDALAGFLRKLPVREAALLAPRNCRDLLRLFPVLARVEVLLEMSRRGPDIPDPQEVKRRAFSALKELLARLGDRYSPVMFIDDMQWGDLDSAVLLRELLWGADQPSMLVIGCYRSEEVGTSAMLTDLLGRGARLESDHRKLEVGELSEREAVQLAELLLTGERFDTSSAVALASESGGVPFLMAELARFLVAREEVSRGTGDPRVSLDELIQWRTSRLPEESRRLLEAVAVSGRPTSVSICMRAALHDVDELRSLGLLRAEHLIRIRQGDFEEELTTYHDRIRESVVAALGRDVLDSYHLRLGESLESSDKADPELLMNHFLKAGVQGKAERYAVEAANLAFEGLAFDRASRLYKLALEIGGMGAAENHGLLVKLADSLANASRGPEAAEVYLEAAEGQDAETVLKLRHTAAYQFLATGHKEEGVRVARDVLKSAGMRLPAYNSLDIARILLRRVWLRIRGVRFRERSIGDIDSRELLRTDACLTVGMAMAIADPLISMLDFSTRHSILALRTGEPTRVALALSGEGATLAYMGQYRRATKIVDKARRLAQKIEDPFALGMAEFSGGVAEYWAAGNWKEAGARFNKAVEIFSSRCTGASIWLTLAQGLGLINLYYLGRMRELARKHPILLNDARERRDLSAEFLIGESECHNVVYLAADDIDGAKSEVKAVFVPAGRENPFYNWHTLAHNVDRCLYAGDLDDLGKNLPSLWSAASHCQAFRIPLTRCLSLLVYGRGLVGIASVAGDNETSYLLKSVERNARRLERVPMSFSRPGSQIIRAGAATLAGDSEKALALAAEAAVGFNSADMSLHSAVCYRRWGELLGGDEGRVLVADANAAMAEEGIKNPDRWANMIAPGKWAAEVV